MPPSSRGRPSWSSLACFVCMMLPVFATEVVGPIFCTHRFLPVFATTIFLPGRFLPLVFTGSGTNLPTLICLTKIVQLLG